jgi:spore maturation protein CgeB
MRIAIVDTYYPAFLSHLYATRPELARRSYPTQLAGIMDSFFGTADSYSVHLQALGHETIDIVANAQPLQRQWAAEQGVLRFPRAFLARVPTRVGIQISKRVWRSIARAQIEAFAPDIVYCQNLAFFTRRDLEAFRAKRLLVVGQIASPLPPSQLIEGFDLIVTSFPHFVERLRARGTDAEYLPLGFDARIIDRLRGEGVDPGADSPRQYDVAFVGGVNPLVHKRRTHLLEDLCARRRIDVWGYGDDALPPDSSIRAHFHGEAWGVDMYRVLASTKIAINFHIDVAEGHVNNMRLYEATGMGALLLTDSGLNLEELFQVGAEVVSYHGIGDLTEAVDRYLLDESARCAIAAAGQRRTLAEHNVERRIEELAGILQRALGHRAAVRGGGRRPAMLR